ncbi:hypothetical protein SAMN04487818_101357 [Actinokineospora terrae]|uniref:Uncharacterized protein n=1 Tax=Actinokineospora terrae TaxID=155974 RepID=A0A1H9KWZ2_9PSEU|nr:hypothetical protein SAMN04487818_101357 [Actinokineospora terrae]
MFSPMKDLITAMPVLSHPGALRVSVITRIVPDRDRFDLPLDLADLSTAFGCVSCGISPLGHRKGR